MLTKFSDSWTVFNGFGTRSDSFLISGSYYGIDLRPEIITKTKHSTIGDIGCPYCGAPLRITFPNTLNNQIAELVRTPENIVHCRCKCGNGFIYLDTLRLVLDTPDIYNIIDWEHPDAFLRAMAISDFCSYYQMLLFLKKNIFPSSAGGSYDTYDKMYGQMISQKFGKVFGDEIRKMEVALDLLVTNFYRSRNIEFTHPIQAVELFNHSNDSCFNFEKHVFYYKCQPWSAILTYTLSDGHSLYILNSKFCNTFVYSKYIPIEIVNKIEKFFIKEPRNLTREALKPKDLTKKSTVKFNRCVVGYTPKDSESCIFCGFVLKDNNLTNCPACLRPIGAELIDTEPKKETEIEKDKISEKTTWGTFDVDLHSIQFSNMVATSFDTASSSSFSIFHEEEPEDG